MNTFIKSFFLTVLFAAASLTSKAQQFGYIQIAHNCSDPSLDTLDIYFNGTVLDSNVVYHAATGLFAYQADTAFTIGVAYKHSNGIPGYIRLDTFPGVPVNGRNAYIISGVNGSGFSANPNGISTSVNIIEIPLLDTLIQDTGRVDIRFFNGVTDLPAINIRGLNGGPLYVHGLTYGASTADVAVRHTIYELQVTSQDSTQNYGTFYADLTALAQQPVIILCSGFLNPGYNNNGPAFGLFVLESNGSVLTLPLEVSAFQLLHNCADPAADSLDIYINSQLAFQSLGFRNATPGLLLNANATYNIGIAQKHSASVSDTFWHKVFDLPRDTFFIATASGLLTQTGFAPNPNGISTAFDVLVKVPAEISASASSNFDFFFINGVTDAGGLSIVPAGGPRLLSDVEYSKQTNYVSLPSEFYTLNLQDTSGNDLASGFANFLSFPSQTGVLLASGFLNPATNNNGPALGFYMSPITGGPFIPLFGLSGVNDVSSTTAFQIFPNPANDQLHVLFTLSKAETVSLQITDINGNVVNELVSASTLTGEQNIPLDLTHLSSGVYYSRLTTSEGTANSRFVVIK